MPRTLSGVLVALVVGVCLILLVLTLAGIQVVDAKASSALVLVMLMLLGVAFWLHGGHPHSNA
jgi:hypothetical protein